MGGPGGDAVQTRNLPKLLNEKIERTHVFYSKEGMNATNIKKEKKLSEYYLSNQKGIAMVCTPHEGTLKPNSQVEVTIQIFNEIAGSFKDKLVAKIRGLEPQEFPINMNIRGSPLVIPTDQVGLGISEIPYTLNLGGMLVNTEPLRKPLRIDNTGTQPLKVKFSIYSIDELDQQRDQFRIRIGDPEPGTGNIAGVKFEPIKPEKTSETPFQIDQEVISLPAKSTKIINVEYQSNDIKLFRSVLIAEPIFDLENSPQQSRISSLSNTYAKFDQMYKTEGQSGSVSPGRSNPEENSQDNVIELSYADSKQGIAEASSTTFKSFTLDPKSIRLLGETFMPKIEVLEKVRPTPPPITLIISQILKETSPTNSQSGLREDRLSNFRRFSCSTSSVPTFSQTANLKDPSVFWGPPLGPRIYL